MSFLMYATTPWMFYNFIYIFFFRTDRVKYAYILDVEPFIKVDKNWNDNFVSKLYKISSGLCVFSSALQ